MPELTLMFLATVFSLGTALVWMFWEIERARSRPHDVKRSGHKSRNSRD
jgi:hypothetical protein